MQQVVGRRARASQTVRRLWVAVTSIWALVNARLGGGVVLGMAAQLVHGASWPQSPSAAAMGAGLVIIVSKRTSEVAAGETHRNDAILGY